ncbi:MAG: DJ-1/PfpI family protein [Ignavibacteria bacterium]|nr:DJ-1/PfpI family protein [Ignavibacteria bacterium]
MSKYSDKSVAFFIPEKNFHDLEFSITKSILEKNGIRIFIASESKNLSQGQFGLRIKPDVYLYNLHPENFKALVLIGGSGSKNYWKNEQLIRTIKNFFNKKKILGAICSAVGILASAELLNGRNVACFQNDIEYIKSSGAIISNKLVEVDNKIVTASGPEAAELFGKTLTEVILKN